MVDRLLPGMWHACCDFHLAPQCRHQTQIAEDSLQIYKQSSNLIRILAVEIRIGKYEFNIPSAE